MFRVVFRGAFNPRKSLSTRKCFTFFTETGPRTCRNLAYGRGIAIFQPWHRSFTSQDSESLAETELDPAQMREIWAGKFPANFCGEVINIKTSHKGFHHIKNAFNHGEDVKKHPNVKVNYNANFSTTSVLHKNTAIHQAVVSDITKRLTKTLCDSNPAFDFMADIRPSSGASAPDLIVTYDDELESTLPIFAVEVGFTESSQSLADSMRQLLEDPESEYLKAKEVGKVRAAAEQGLRVKVGERFEQKSAYEGASLGKYDVRWVGDIKGSVPVWKRDPASGKAEAFGESIIS